MSLATRCTACGTIFRVVQDQLKVSEGWVRCGRCDTVFNAVEALFDLERETPPAWHAPQHTPPPHGSHAGAHTDAAPAREPEWQAPPRRDGLAPPPTMVAPPGPAPAPRVTPEASQPALNELLDDANEPPLADGLPATIEPPPGRIDSEERVDISALLTRPDVSELDADLTMALPAELQALPRNPFHSATATPPLTIDAAGHDPVWQSPEFEPHREAPALGLPSDPNSSASAATVDIPLGDDALANTVFEAPPSPDDDDDAAPGDTPRFVTQANRAARWRRPLPRALLSLLALGLIAGLVGQVALQRRDLLAQQVPALRPLLQAGCEQLGCAIQLPRRIEDLVVESSALTPATEPTGALRLSVGVRNRGELTLALPAIDLQLTDASGQPVLRRALTPADFGQKAPAAIAPGAEAQLQLLFAHTGPRVTGYTVEVFYP
jgi:predicted Zn finger-like uncharacterized protein